MKAFLITTSVILTILVGGFLYVGTADIDIEQKRKTITIEIKQ